MYTYVYIYVYIYTSMSKNIFYLNICMYVYVCIYIHTYIHTYIYIFLLRAFTAHCPHCPMLGQDLFDIWMILIVDLLKGQLKTWDHRLYTRSFNLLNSWHGRFLLSLPSTNHGSGEFSIFVEFPSYNPWFSSVISHMFPHFPMISHQTLGGFPVTFKDTMEKATSNLVFQDHFVLHLNGR